jgi:hypothetical protein
MKASTANHSCPLWQNLYEAAILELDARKLPQRIAMAQHAILGRIEDLKSRPDYEREPLMKHLVETLRLLRTLGRIAGIEGNS